MIVGVRLRLTLEYDGTGFRGWARQPGERTVEGTLREALDKLARMLDGPLILNEHAWDRLEPMTPEWEEEHAGLHGYGAMRPALDARFDERFFEWRPYQVDGVDVPGLGFRYVGEPR
jgi:hypothetical protein